ncbi:hypothetical protein HA49_13160 [Tatumella morbirosei]|uniref:Uncharacterized protein n=1 Tax=Tatumella morbirosei TaxID=642227 RepID=A0A095T9G6_9GAMM|nr:hypothetical protein HA49_13160 [Tatumella morbirosei]
MLVAVSLAREYSVTFGWQVNQFSRLTTTFDPGEYHCLRDFYTESRNLFNIKNPSGDRIMNAEFFPGAGVLIWLAYVVWIAGYYGHVLSSF